MSENQNQQIELKEAAEFDFLNEFDLAKFQYVAKRSIVWVLLLFFLGATGIFLFLRYVKPIYKASSTLKLNFKSSKDFLGLDIGFFNEGIDAINLAGEIQLIRSKLIYEGVIDSANLRIAYYSEGEVLDTEKFGTAPFRAIIDESRFEQYDQQIGIEIVSESTFQIRYEYFGEEVVEEHTFNRPFLVGNAAITIEKQEQFFPSAETYGKFFFVVQSNGSLFKYLGNNLEVEVANQTAQTLSISFSAHDRDKAIAIVRAVNQNYLVQTLENKNQVYEQSLDYLDRQLRITNDTLDFYEKELQRYTSFNRDELFEPTIQETVAGIIELEDELVKTDLEITDYDRIQNLIVSDSSVVYLKAAVSMLSNQNLANTIQEIVGISDNLDRIRTYYKETTFARQQNEQQIARLKSEALEMISFTKEGLYTKKAENQRQLRELEANLTGDQDGIDPEYKKLNRFYSIYEAISNTILNKKIEIGIAKAGTVPDFQILAQANASSIPIFPVVSNVYIIGIGTSIILSIFWVVVAYLLENRINSLRALESAIKVPIAGTVPEVYRKDMEFSQLLVDLNPKSSISEAMRTIRTNLDFINTQKDAQRVISVTSTVSGEGKTFVALNLAGTIALTGAKVVLVDLDMRKPKIHLAFNEANAKGVSTILGGRTSLDECIFPTPISTMHFIPSGAVPPNPSELLLSEDFEKMLENLKNKFDVVLMDTPPVGLVTDGVIAMKQATLPIYVLRAEYSKINFASNVNQLSARKDFKNISAILNAVNQRNTYGYAYNYNYGYGNTYSPTYGGYYGDYFDENNKEKKGWFSRLFS